ncbi:hypothetical protein HN51_031039 [Arachis hypogaea]|uniref:DUF1685 family protein n=2 Tax=Arachis TaxID=3817 RepID=A0A445B8Q8_ARAHY|nr:uncharacterized protein LOC112715222 [Arachis hypogaea]XP_052111754.1 uncharacterized protein LOC107469232 [Arachis duranensis]QHO15622.1 uncharacterized protein DS421_10g296530 [Arachis hypogaea]RYR35068.1 hypothetical protein Ahy_A10g050179 isoform C [Arachis hypogaea]
MEAETVLKLFDSCWFGIQDMKEQEPCSSSSHENTNHQTKEGISESEEPMLLRSQTIHTRSMSDQLDNRTCSMHDDSSSPEFEMLPSKLQTILSGKDITDTEQDERQAQVQVQLEGLPKKNNNNNKRRGRKKRRGSKSLSDLEFEELKGFMDLGFVFSEEDKDSSLASILPGLQRLGKKSVKNDDDDEDGDDDDEDEENCDKAAVPRPYLSEAWKVHKKKKENPLKNWKVPALNNENDIKDSIKLWAHTVASTVR